MPTSGPISAAVCVLLVGVGSFWPSLWASGDAEGKGSSLPEPLVAVPQADSESRSAIDLSSDVAAVSPAVLPELQEELSAQKGSEASRIRSRSTVWTKFVKNKGIGRNSQAAAGPTQPVSSEVAVNEPMASHPAAQVPGPETFGPEEGLASEAAAENFGEFAKADTFSTMFDAAAHGGEQLTALLADKLHDWRQAVVLKLKEIAVYCGSHKDLTWAVLPLERLVALASEEIPSGELRCAGLLFAAAAVLLLLWATQRLLCRRRKAQKGLREGKAEAELSEEPVVKATPVDSADSSLQSLDTVPSPGKKEA